MNPSLRLSRAAALPALALLLLTAAAGAGCGRHRHAATGPAGPDLTVAAALPRGETGTRASVDVVFDRPVVAMGAADPNPDQGRKYLELDPMPPGAYHWIGTRTLSYTVPGGLPAATRFRARVPAGLKAVDGSRLKSEVAWEFSTPRPRLTASIPEDGANAFPPGDPLLLVFNQPVDPGTVAGAVELDRRASWRASHPDSAFLAAAGWRFRETDPARAVLLRHERDLDPDHAYKLRVSGGLAGLAGPLTLGADTTVSFHTYGPIGLAGVAGGAQMVLRFTTPVDPDSVRSHLVLFPDPGPLDVWGSQAQAVVGGLAPGTTYKVTLTPGLADFFGQVLAKPVDFTFTSADREPFLEILPGNAVLPDSAAKRALVRYGGLTEVRVRVGRLDVAGEVRARAGQLSPEPAWDLDRVVYRGAPGNALQTETLDLAPYLDEGRGAVEILATGKDASTGGDRAERTERAVIRFSGLGLTVKAGSSGGTAWVTGLLSGDPAPGVTVHLRDRAGKPLWSGVSDPRGLVSFPSPARFGKRTWETALTASRGADAALCNLTGDWRLSAWRFGIPGSYTEESTDLHAYIYGDRDLYRPGETVHLTGLVRRFNEAGVSAAGIDSLSITLRNPVGETTADTALAVDRFGGFALAVPVAASAPTGAYWVSAVVVSPDRKQQVTVGSASVRIAAYRAPAFRATVDALTPGAYPGTAVAGRVEAGYYFGAPLAGAPFTWNLLREAAPFTPPGFEDYDFSDPENQEPEAAQVAAGAGALGDSGRAAVTVPVGSPTWSGSQRFTLEASVRDPSGDTVTGRALIPYHPASVAPGIALSRRFVPASTPETVKLVAVRTDSAALVRGVPLTVRFIRRQWRTTRKLLVGGRVGFESTRLDSLIESREVTSGIEPLTISWQAPSAGSYRVEAEAVDPLGRRALAATSFYVAGPRGPQLGPPTEEPFLELTADKARYRPGETAHVLLTTPVRAGRGVLTVEREGVLEARVVRLDGPAPSFDVPVTDAYAPNVFVGLSVVEPARSEAEAPGLPAEARLARFAAGYVELALDASNHRLTVEAAPARDTYRPGEEATVTLRVRGANGAPAPARVSVAVVDEAVLALLGNPGPDPFGFFYAERGLGVRTDDSRLALRLGAQEALDRMKGEAGGGGGEGSGYRTLFATTAYWNPAVLTDDHGDASVTFKLPDNLTRFRVIATAASRADRFGSGTGEFTVTRPVTVTSALPRFALTGDRFDAAALVVNRTAQPVTGTVSLATGLTAEGRTEAAVRVEPGGSARVAFPVRAARAGSVSVAFRADFGPYQDAVRALVPVVDPLLTRAAAASGRTSGSTPEDVALPPESVPGSAGLALTLSPSMVAGAEQAFTYLLDYPFGCLEQTASKLLGLSLYKELIVSGNGTWSDSLKLDEKLADGVARMQRLARPWGGFTFWPGGEEASAPLQAYAVLALARAGRAGAPVPSGLLERAGQDLTNRWQAAASRWNAEGNSAPVGPVPFGLYLFAAAELSGPGGAGVLRPGDLDAVSAHLGELDTDQKLFLALALNRLGTRPEIVGSVLQAAENRVNLTAGGAVVPAEEVGETPSFLGSPTRSTALTLLLAVRVRADDPLVPRLAGGLLGLREHGRWRNTHEDALALFALVEYRERVERGEAGPFTARVALQGRREPLLAREFAAGSLAEARTRVPLPAPSRRGETLQLQFSRTGTGSLVYDAVLRWKESALDRAPREGAYTLVRRVDPFRGSAEPRVGDLVVVTLQIVVPAEAHYLALVDPLPAGLEVVQTGFRVESSSANLELERWRGGFPEFPATYADRRDRETRFFADLVEPGVYQLRYLARVRAAGDFGHPAATLEAMYAPELGASSASPAFRASGPEGGGGR